MYVLCQSEHVTVHTAYSSTGSSEELAGVYAKINLCT